MSKFMQEKLLQVYCDTNEIDFLSNGFKFRSTGAPHFGTNSAGNIYLAFAESPFKNARAR